ncbi:hypothetical protein ACTWQF_27460 [Streptomyces sp. 8N114]|uniref:hypothetical protein n=1 Tax=Streptomyces sp. 8N114 TaxID=3457419 RepID=UPI003FD3F70D
MSRRPALALATLLAATVLAAAPAAAASAPKPHDLTPREHAAVKITEKILGTVLGGVVNLGGS